MERGHASRRPFAHLHQLRFFAPVLGQRPAAPDLIPAEEDDSYLAPKVILRYRPSDDQTYYGSISRGVKPGGISTLTGREVEDIPRHSLFAGLSWRSEMANGAEFMVDLDVQYQGARWQTEWNLLDDDTIKTGFGSPDFDAIRVYRGFVPPPRVPPPPASSSFPLHSRMRCTCTCRSPAL